MPALQQENAHRLEDGVVTLRPWEDGDVPALVDAIDDPDVYRWIDQIPSPYGEADAREFLARSRENRAAGATDNFAVLESASGRLVGGIGVRWSDERDVGEIGYWLRRDARGRGLTTRALVLVARWALSQPGVARLQLRADVLNVPSRRVAEHAGFRLEGILRSAYWSVRQQRRFDWAMYSLLPDESP